MKKIYYLILIIFFLITSCASVQDSNASTAPQWVSNLESVYPSRDWVAVTAEGSNQQQAEAAAMNALARAFRTDVASLTQSSLQFTQIIDNSAENRSITFNESRNFSQDVNVTANVRGLIGVQLETYRSANTVYVNARMNRRECSARYSAMIRENTAIINRLLVSASAIQNRASFDVYSRLSFAHSVAQVTDNFQNILEVLDSSESARRPSYGGANAIRTRMIECASLITIGITVNTEQPADRVLITRAAGSFFTELGFKINENGAGNYVLNANVRFEDISQNVFSCRYFIDASLSGSGAAVFSFTENDRKAHPNMAREARRLAVRAVEDSFKEAQFAVEFNKWLFGMLE